MNATNSTTQQVIVVHVINPIKLTERISTYLQIQKPTGKVEKFPFRLLREGTLTKVPSPCDKTVS